MTSAAWTRETNGLFLLSVTRTESWVTVPKSLEINCVYLQILMDAEMPNRLPVLLMQCLPGKTRITHATVGSHSLLHCRQEYG